MFKGLQKSLIDHLTNNGTLSGQYENFRCVTYTTTGREGCMSLVFRATDKLANNEVAVKFVDPDLVAKAAIDAIGMFDREYQTMELLEGNTRSAQLAGPQGDLMLPITLAGSAAGSTASLRVTFFPIEWLDGDVNNLFLDQSNVPCLEKLEFIRELFLAVESVHNLGIAHRDLKRDNIRLRTAPNKADRVIIIDFGLAVAANDPKMAPMYPLPRGAYDFSPPETFLGFEGERDLVGKADTYALGAILYSVFNSAGFGFQRIHSTEFAHIVNAHHVAFISAPTRGERMMLWHKLVYDFRLRLKPPDIAGVHSSLPAHVAHLVDRTYRSLTHFDFEKRPKGLKKAIADIESAIKVIRNHKSEQRDRQRRRLLRQRKLIKQQARLQRLKQLGYGSNA